MFHLLTLSLRNVREKRFRQIDSHGSDKKNLTNIFQIGENQDFPCEGIEKCVSVEVSLKFDVGCSPNLFPGCISSQYQVATKDPA